ncbi:phytoene desaturase family protein [Aeromicrobium ginsengisoli]|uniref:NAD(P)/FAD-dependent oxidoreductase n=1 Tax=Aeromicrobium ginsengisoli TaxID=363867 RepID=A0A5M4F9Z8_9ACTN|nr:NAD(P)/FAD-dependent oxidoreductase [Aeromicrobium ginsengisoli]KAA1395223.1 NAD(P)/FAD-dependent oxidoreductase [Aeromicrobium ginsengisoli]
MTTATVVGSGPNGLAAALTLADAGVEVTVLEAQDRLGGGASSSELTLPGLVHDDCSAIHPLAIGSAFAKQFDLTAAGLTWRWPEVQFSHPLDGGRGGAVWRSVETTADELGADGRSWRRLFGPLAERFEGLSADILQPVLHVPKHPVHLARFGAYAALTVPALGRRWETPEARGLFAGAAAHTFRPFSGILSSSIPVALGASAHALGWPVAEGGTGEISRAIIELATARGVRFETGITVTSLDQLGGPDIVMLDTSPRAAADIVGERMPARVARAYRRYRHAAAAFKVDYAVEGGVPWTHEPSRSAGTVHLGGGFDEIAAAELAVSKGQMPERPFVLIGQQYVADPTRSRDGVDPLYAYAHVPSGYTGDATEAITSQIERFAPGFRDRIRATHVRTTGDFEAGNPNLVGGDIIAGANTARQLVFRPRTTLHPYATGAPGVHLCSAATPPGAGAHGMCGYNAARYALRRA